MGATLELKNGRTLHLRPVKWSAAWKIIRQLGGMGVLDNLDDLEGTMESLTASEALQAADASQRLFDYCAGWGVTDEPPEEEIAGLVAAGLAPADPHLARAAWLQFNVLADDDEVSTLIAEVLALSQPRSEGE